MSPGTRASIVYPKRRRPRIQLDWVAGRMKPGLNADVQSSTEAERTIADEDLEITGSNVLRTDTLHDISGAIRMLNATGGATDSVIFGGHEDANQSGWGVFTWDTDQETEWECLLSIGPSITAAEFFAGLKLTNDSAIGGNDNEAYFFAHDAGTGSGAWQAVFSAGANDSIRDLLIAPDVSTLWHLAVRFDENEVCRMYLNDALVASQSFQGNTVSLLPFVGVVEATSGTIPRLFLHRMAISRALDV